MCTAMQNKESDFYKVSQNDDKDVSGIKEARMEGETLSEFS